MGSRVRDISHFMRDVFKTAQSSKNCEKLLRDVHFKTANNGYCSAELTLSERHLNEDGILNSRIIANLIERMTTFALMSYNNKICGNTINTNIQFLSPVDLDSNLIIDSHVLKVNDPVGHVESQLWTNEGRLIALGQSIKYLKNIPAPEDKKRKRTIRIVQSNF
ncbi:uncharacterized protein LOC122499298 [Leptopilina heterotoma]|uniref:uncharacterized protein LOC122499298 n=1 Tax=Leptopilina heterotoma TaxID=63436 RepID=UPI001CA82D2F|nr:uncharacterized protein LOC122499298 [Leptopilina heterotoma]XP_043463513.1 uncharacterized protein LOC122499298 [Leptopilina heterotoma]